MPSKKGQLRILLVSGEAAHTELLRESLARHVELVSVGTLPEMLGMLEAQCFDVVVCDKSFRGGTWADALEAVRRLHPEVPTVIVSRLGDEQEWIEVLEAGAFDLLAAPYCERAVLSVLEHAVASYQGRSYLNSAA